MAAHARIIQHTDVTRYVRGLSGSIDGAVSGNMTIMKLTPAIARCLPALRFVVAALALVVCATPGLAGTATVDVTVDGTMNIYGSGHLTAPGPCGNGGGILPFETPIPAGTGRSVQFSLSGTISYGACCPTTGPDGSAGTGSVPQPQYNGLAGCNVTDRIRYLVAVFLDDSEPMDPPPDSLVVASDFSDLSPGLRQIFFVGDGLTGQGTGGVQTFHIPDGATRLFMGYSDRCSASTPNQPGYYSDNSGTVTGSATFTVATGVESYAPKAFRLEPNFPNPFSSNTTLSFSVKSPAVFHLSVYDIRGRLVRSLLNGWVEGARDVSWDGRDGNGNPVPSGIYYYRLTCGSQSSTRKMLLLR